MVGGLSLATKNLLHQEELNALGLSLMTGLRLNK